MATDILLDDKTGECITLNCAEVATSALDITLDHPESRKTSGGTRTALRHNEKDGLSINPERDYPDGVALECGSINLKVNELKSLNPKLPKRAKMGDLYFLHTKDVIPAHLDMPDMVVENCTLWLCVGHASSGVADWAPVTLGTHVAGTL